MSVMRLAYQVDPVGPQPSQYQVDEFSRYHTYTNWSVQVTGTFSGCQVQLEGSLDNVTWVSIGTTMNSPGIYFKTLGGSPQPAVIYVRANILAITSGAVSVYAVGSS